MKHLDVTVKAADTTTVALPAWYGTAAWAILTLTRDPHALDRAGVIDMDAVHRDV